MDMAGFKERIRRNLLSLRHFFHEVKAKIAERAAAVHGREAVQNLVNLIFPPHALEDFHNRPQGSDHRQSVGLEAGSWAQIRFLDAEGCDMCARPFTADLHMGDGARCLSCGQKPFVFMRARAACVYDEASKGVILAFKHADRLDLAPMLTRWLERAAAPLKDDIDVVVPVPLHPSRLWARRYNQAAELARPLAKHMGRAYVGDGLRRIKKTHAQGAKGGGFAARHDNVKDAFNLSPYGQKALRGRAVLLVDDVFTTGATLNACAKTLLKGGARCVFVAVLARVVPKDSL
jgi:ComF family protein